MSKSKGNVVAPQKICNQLGADILRLWISAADYRHEMTVSDEIIKRTADAYRRIRNTARFLLANLNGFNPEVDQLHDSDLLPLDAWMVGKAAKLQTQIIEAYDAYQFHQVYQLIHHFCSVDLGSFYLDIIKDRQYTCQTESKARRSAQTALYHLLQALTRWIAPILSFTADEIWDYLPGKQAESNVFIAHWYPLAIENTQAEDAFWNQMMTARQALMRQLEVMRNEKKLKASLMAEVTFYAEGELYDALDKVGDELRFITLTSQAEVKPLAQATESTLATDIETLKLDIKVSDAPKCPRCWHYRDDIGQAEAVPDLCQRCVDNVYGQGETRHFA